MASSTRRQNFSPTCRAHAGHDEGGVHAPNGQAYALDARQSGDERFVQSRLLPGARDALGIGFLADGELEGVVGGTAGMRFLEAAGIDQQVDARARADAVVAAAMGADLHGLLDIGLVQRLLAAFTLDPEAVGHDGLLSSRLRLPNGVRLKNTISAPSFQGPAAASWNFGG